MTTSCESAASSVQRPLRLANGLAHGGDYNPDQWLDRPDVLAEDLRLMEQVCWTTSTLGVFAWSRLEPEEGRFEFDWLDRTMDDLAQRGMTVALATPSGARPAWLAQKYPEVLRVGPTGLRAHFDMRHNHCPTSPVYREKCRVIDEKLAERYAGHPALALWHISNEFSGECFCDLCIGAFHEWLREKYGTIDALNAAYWADFWAHRYTDWSQVWPVDAAIETVQLDWKRYTSDQTVSFMCNEIAAIRRHSQEVPATTNMMGAFKGLDYRRLAEHVDVIADDWYPSYFGRDMTEKSPNEAFRFDLMRGLRQGRPWLMLESCPSNTNWQHPFKVKAPGELLLLSMQAVSRGSDGVMYFQWRKGRGGNEKHHGAVVDHAGGAEHRVFREVAEVGRTLRNLAPVQGTTIPAEAAVIFDWESRWTLGFAGNPDADRERYIGCCMRHHRPLSQQGVLIDVVAAEADLSRYKLVVAPMLYLLRPGVADALRRFVEAGGTLVVTFQSGIVDQNVQCFTGGWPGGGLRELPGVWVEEMNELLPDDPQQLAMSEGNTLGLSGRFNTGGPCDLTRAEGAEILATYTDQWFAGRPALTVNRVGKGRAFYLATDPESRFFTAFYGKLADELDLRRAIDVDLPAGVEACLPG